MDERDAMIARSIVGKTMRDGYEANPPDVSEWVRALDGCAELYQHASGHLSADPPRFGEAVRCLRAALSMGSEVNGQATLAYVLSGEATDDFMGQLREQFTDGRP